MSNLTATTRALYIRSVEKQVFEKLALFAILKEHRHIAFKGGTNIEFPVETATVESLMQDYIPTEGMTGGSKTIMEKASWNWKYNQLPVTYNAQEEIENAGGVDTAPINLVDKLVEAAQNGTKRGFANRFYTSNTTATDSGKKFQSVIDALCHTATPYGGLARTTAVRTIWMGASVDGTWTDQAVAYTPSIAMFRQALDRCRQYRDPGEKWYAISGSSIHRAFKSQCDARMVNTKDGTRLARFGFETMNIDGVEFVLDPYLDTMTPGTTTKYFFLINPETWELRLFPKRAMKFTGFTWQGDQVGGLDAYLGRVMSTGNLVCKQPNANIWLSNVA
jgi:hypothetical protein